MKPLPRRLPAPLRRAGRELCRAILDLLCPPGCPACGVPGEGLCRGCRRHLEVRPAPLCGRCGIPLPAPGAACGADHRRLRGLSWARAPLAYRGTGGDLVRRAKFDRDRAALEELARRMAWTIEAWARGPGRRARVVSVPLHPRKLRRRGHDQAAALAEAVARRVGLRFEARVLARLRDTLPQGDVRVTSRARNVEGAFDVRRPGRVRDRLVVLVDDVCTSGSTAVECARVLSAAGARGVAVLTAAQA